MLYVLPSPFKFPDGSLYTGEYKRVSGRILRHGRGTHSDGSSLYEGEWRNDRLSGNVKVKLATGETYVGEMVDNMYHGNGIYTWRDGASYSGSWQNSKMHGEGVYSGTDAVKWEGTFQNGAFYNGRAWVDVRST